jgi:hypothetical protein
VGVVRSLIALLILIASDEAQAQFPYGYSPHIPRNPPYGGQYSPPAQNRSPASLAQAMLDAHNVIRARWTYRRWSGRINSPKWRKTGPTT